MSALALDRSADAACLDGGITTHSLLIKQAASPIVYALLDIQPNVALRANSQTILTVRASPIPVLYDRSLARGRAVRQLHHLNSAAAQSRSKRGSIASEVLLLPQHCPGTKFCMQQRPRPRHGITGRW